MGQYNHVPSGSAIELIYIAEDGDTSLFPQAVVRDSSAVAVAGSPFNLTHVANGFYRTTVASLADGRYSAHYIPYTDAGHTILSKKHGGDLDSFEIDPRIAQIAALETKAQADARQVILVAEHDATQATLATQETKAEADARQAILVAEHDATQVTLATLETKSQADARQALLIAEHDATQSAIGALNDPTAAAIADAVWDEALGDHTTAGSMGFNQNLLDDIEADTSSLNDTKITTGRADNLDNLNATITSRESEADASSRAAADIAEHNATQATLATMETKAQADARQVLLIAEHDSTQADIAALENLSAAEAADAVWDEALGDHVTAGSMGFNQNLLDDIEADTSSLNDTKITTGRADNLDNLDAAITSRESESDASSRAAADIAEHDTTQAAIAALNDPSAGAIADAVWDEALAGHTGVGTAGGHQNLLDDIESDTSTLNDTKITSPRASNLDNLNATVSSRATQTSVDAIQNNTRFVGIVPQPIKLPDTGTKDYKFYGRLFDTAGNPEDPDTNTMNVRIEEVDGTVVVATTAMTRTGVGLYEYTYVVNSSDTKQPLVVFFDYDENSVSFQHVRTTEVVEFESTLDGIASDTAAIKAQTDQMNFTGANIDARAVVVVDKTDYALTGADKDNIVDRTWDELLAGHTIAGSAGKALADAGAAGVPPTVGEIADAVWDEALAGHTVVGSTGEAQNLLDDIEADTSSLNDTKITTGRADNLDNLDAAITTRESESSASSRAATNQAEHDATQATLATQETKAQADARQAILVAEHDDTQAAIGALNDPTAAAVADAVWDEAFADHTAPGSMGLLQNLLDDIESDTSSLNDTKITTGRADNLDNLDTTISSREAESDASSRAAADIAEHNATQATLATIETKAQADIRQAALVAEHDSTQATLATHETKAQADARQALLIGEHDTTQAAIAALNDPDAAAIADAVWDEAKAGHTAVGSFGEANQGVVSIARANLLDNLDATITSRQAETDALARANADIAQHGITQAAIAALNDPDAGAIADAVWDELRAGHTGIGTFGESNQPSVMADAVWDEQLSGHTTAGSAGKTLADLAAGSTPGAIADAVWDEAAAAHMIADTFGEYVNVIRQTTFSTNDEVTDGSTGLAAIKAQVISSESNIIVEVNANEVKIDALSAQLTAAESNIIFEVDENETKIDNLSAQLTAAESNIIAEVDQNEVKIDALVPLIESIQNNTTTRFVVPAKIQRPVAGTKDYEFHFRLYNTQGEAEAPDSTPTVTIKRLDTGTDLVTDALMTHLGSDGAYKYVFTVSAGTPLAPLLVEATVVENSDTRLVPMVTEVCEFQSDLDAIQAQLTDVENIVTDNQNNITDVTFGLAAIKANHANIIAEIDENEAKLDLIIPQTNLIPADPATSAEVAAAEAAALSRPDLADIQTEHATTRSVIRGIDGRDLTEVYDKIDFSGLLSSTDPRLDTLDANISSRSTLTAADVWAHAVRTLTAFTLPPADIQAIWDKNTGDLSTASSIGKLLADNVDAPISSRATPSDITGPLVGVAQEATLLAAEGNIITEINVNEGKIDDVKAETALIDAKTTNLPSDPAKESTVQVENDATQAAIANMQLDVTGIKDKTDNLPADPAADSSIAAIPTNPLLDNDARVDNLDAPVSSRSTLDGTDLDPLATTAELSAATGLIIDEVDENEVKIDAVKVDTAAIKAKTDNLPATPADEATLVQGITDIRDDIANIPGSSLTAADVWSFATRELTQDPNDFKADVSGLATSAELAAATASNVVYANHMTTVFNEGLGQQELLVWATKNGVRVAGASDADVTIKTATGTTIWSDTLASPSADGIFRFLETGLAPLVINANYYITVTITVDGSPRTVTAPFITA